MTFLSVAELSAASGRHEKTIRRAITTGRLAAERDAETGQWQITPEAGYALYPPLKQLADERAEALEIKSEPEPEPEQRERGGAPQGWHEGFSDGQLDACRAIVTLDCSPELWAALRAILL